MASVEDYRIPWKPLDLGPGIDTLLSERHKREEERRAEENAQTQREFAERNFRSQASKDYREERAWKDMIAEREKADKERKQAAIPVLMAASKAYARQYGPENAASMLNAQGNPYVHFAPQDFVPAPGAAPQQMPATPLSAAANMQGPPAPEPQAPPAEAPTMNIEGAPVPAPAAPVPPQAEVPTGDIHDVQPTPQMPEPYTPADVSQTAGNELHAPGSEPVPATAPQAPPPATPAQIQHVLMAQFLGGGKPFAIPSQTQGMGLGGKYDQMYNMLVDAGVPEDKAREKVFAQNMEDTKETARDTRLADAIAGRKENIDAHTYTVAQKQAQFDELQRREDERNKVSARSRTASAGAGPTPGGVGELVTMAENGEPLSAIAARAAELHLSEKLWMNAVQNVVKNAASGERAGQKREALEVTDETGKVLGVAHSPDAAKTLNKSNQSFDQLRTRMNALIDDIKSTGSRVLTADEWQRRESLAASVAAAGRVYNGLGATDASQRLEQQIIGAMGTPGHGWLMGANLGVVEHTLREAEQSHQSRINIGLRSGGGSRLAPALGGKKAPPAENPQHAAARKWLADPANANSPYRAGVQARLQAEAP
jgi:hypothetical protein